MLKVGDTAPDFELLNQDRKLVRLSDFRGKPVVIFTFPKAGTLGCTYQACDLRDVFPKLERNDVVILGISPDMPEDLKAWQQRERLCYDLLSDPNHTMLNAWGLWGVRLLFVDFEKVVRSLWVLDENGIIHTRHAPVHLWESGKRAVEALATLPSLNRA